jgi:hypothetical protein
VQGEGTGQNEKGEPMFTLQCTSYREKGEIPAAHAEKGVKGGKNVSPGFTWNDPPITTQSFAFSIVDPHPVARNWIHWLIINIPFRERALVEGVSREHSLPPGTRELCNSSNQIGYSGPYPPKGSGVHPYVATIYALNTAAIALAKECTLSQFLRAIEGKVIAEASMTGYFEQKG